MPDPGTGRMRSGGVRRPAPRRQCGGNHMRR